MSISPATFPSCTETKSAIFIPLSQNGCESCAESWKVVPESQGSKVAIKLRPLPIKKGSGVCGKRYQGSKPIAKILLPSGMRSPLPTPFGTLKSYS